MFQCCCFGSGELPIASYADEENMPFQSTISNLQVTNFICFFLPNNVKGKFSKLLTDVINLFELFANNCIIAVFLNFILHHSFIQYFSHLFIKDFATSTINVRRSTLSMTLEPIDGKKIGDHPLLVQLLKGYYNLKPPNPRYDSM
jgi:hypothetical protein